MRIIKVDQKQKQRSAPPKKKNIFTYQLIIERKKVSLKNTYAFLDGAR